MSSQCSFLASNHYELAHLELLLFALITPFFLQPEDVEMMMMMMMIRMTMGIMKIEGPESSGPCQSLHLFDCLEVVRLFPQLL